MLKKMPLEKAVGTRLAHDITEISERGFKGPAFRKGHHVSAGDVCRLQRLGKNHLYQFEPEEDEIHENEAAGILAQALSGEGIYFDDAPSEGKINLYAAHDGLLLVDAASLAQLNGIDCVMCATIHNNTPVEKGDPVAATRAIPLVMDRTPVKNAEEIAARGGGILRVLPFQGLSAGLIITGTEISQGLVADRFAPILTRKMRALGGSVKESIVVPDDAGVICRAIRSLIDMGCEIIILSGGMSVDPDDVTRCGIEMAGAIEMHYGAAALPGAMFLAAAIGTVSLLGVPACALHFKITVLDLLLPRIMAGQHLKKDDLVQLGHGGLCRMCRQCNYPACSFGKGG